MPRRKGRKRKERDENSAEPESDQEVVFNVPEVKKLKVSPPAPAAELAVVTPTPPPKLEEESENLVPRKSPNGYILPDPLPEGMVITDLKKKNWRLGKSIGLGGFGEIYSAAFLNGDKASNEDYVVKVEPHSNGPLFVELHFYCKATLLDDINAFKTKKKMKHLGIPDLKGLGSFTHRNKKMRFLVLPRYGMDVQQVLDQCNIFSVETTSSLAVQILDCYEYLHAQGYVHKDLKGANLLYSRKQPGENKKNTTNEATANKQVYLLDYGLVSRYTHLGLHKPFEPDQRMAHEGTLEYTSRDSHLGCVSRRGDIEVLLYVLIDWLGGKLAWDVEETLRPTQIQQMKIDAFYDIKGFLTKAFKDKGYPKFLEEIMKTVKHMRFEEAPDYKYLRSLFRPFIPVEPPKINLRERHPSDEDNNNMCTTEDETDDEIIIKTKMRKPSKRRSLPHNIKRQQSTSQPWGQEQMEVYLDQKNQVIRTMCEESLINPTPAMFEQMARIQKRNKGSPSVIGTTRRKGMISKRRLARLRQEGINHLKVARGPPPLPSFAAVRRKGATRELSGKAIRKSPRRVKKLDALGQHLYGLVAPLSNLVKSMFQIPSPTPPPKPTLLQEDK